MAGGLNFSSYQINQLETTQSTNGTNTKQRCAWIIDHLNRSRVLIVTEQTTLKPLSQLITGTVLCMFCTSTNRV